MKSPKPTAIWPVWAFVGAVVVVGIVLTIAYPRLENGLVFYGGVFFWAAVVYSFVVHKRNKKYFGQYYKTSPKLTAEGKKKYN